MSASTTFCNETITVDNTNEISSIACNENSNLPAELTNNKFMNNTSSKATESDLYQQAAFLQQILQGQQQQQHQQQSFPQQHSLPQHQQPPQQPQESNYSFSLPSDNANMQFHNQFSFETLVAPPPAMMFDAGLRQQQIPQQFQQNRPRFPVRTNLSEQERFLLFIKIVMKLTANNPAMKSRAKAIVSECTRRNRMGDLDFTPLQEAVERRLKLGLGEQLFTRARLFFDAYCERSGIRPLPASSSPPSIPVTSI